MREQLRTSTKAESTNPVWDESLFFEAKDQTEEELNRATVEVMLYDMDTFNSVRAAAPALLRCSGNARPAAAVE